MSTGRKKTARKNRLNRESASSSSASTSPKPFWKTAASRAYTRVVRIARSSEPSSAMVLKLSRPVKAMSGWYEDQLVNG